MFIDDIAMAGYGVIKGTSLHHCPVCQDRRIEKWHVSRDVTRARWDGAGTYPMLAADKCSVCGMVFLNPQPDFAVSDEYYAAVYGGKNNSEHGYYRDEFKERVANSRLEQLESLVEKGAKLLDVGAGRGHFVHMAIKRGWIAWALEASSEGCHYARNTFELTNVLEGTLPHSDLGSDFDVVTMWDVIEHMVDPVRALQEANGILKPGGLLLVRTGNISSWAFDRDRDNWWAWFCDHRHYFSAKTLSMALEKAGFYVENVEDFESIERPEKKSGEDIAETSLRDGFAALLISPLKVLKLSRYLRNKWRRYFGAKKHGSSYWISIMTVTARKTLPRNSRKESPSRDQ